MTVTTDQLVAWLSTNGLPLAIGTIVIFLVYRWSRPALHRVLVRIVRAQTAALEEEGMHGQIDKRVDTIEDLLDRLLRLAVGRRAVRAVPRRLRPVADPGRPRPGHRGHHAGRPVASCSTT